MKWMWMAVLLVAAWAVPASAELAPMPGVTEIKQLDPIGAIQLKLANGMTVCIKSSPEDADEVFYRLAAVGGYGAVDPKERVSAEVASEAAWESGMGGMSGDELSVYLYEHSLDLSINVRAFSRMIECEGTRDGVEGFLRCVKMVFTEQNFTKEGWQEAILGMRSILDKRLNDYDYVYEKAYLKLNTQDMPELRMIGPGDLEQANFAYGKDFYRRCFSNPAEFVCVMIGDFDLDALIPLIVEYLGSIPKQEDSRLNKGFQAPFPEGVVSSNLYFGDKSSGVTRLSFPIRFAINERSLLDVAFVCQVIEARLRKAITEKMDLSYGIDVAYEFPLYPLLSNPWIAIRYRCEEKVNRQIKEIILGELSRLQTSGVSAEEVSMIKKLESGSQEFWMRDSQYWISMLTNYYLWGWNPLMIDHKNTELSKLSPSEVNKVLKDAINLGNYSIFTVLPMKFSIGNR